MVFSSAIFLFAFLPICLLLDRVFAAFGWRRLQNSVLLFFSLLFYAYGEGYYVILMIASIVINFVVGLLLERSSETSKKTILLTGVALNLGGLLYYKYFGFLIENTNSVLALFDVEINTAPVHLPIGISFFTFQAISYIVDVYKKEVPVQKNIFDLALYIAMFPQLIAGPIVRYASIQEEIINRKPTLKDISSGFQLFCVGLFQKVVIADTMAKIVDQSLHNVPISDFSTGLAWVWITAYSLQIFFDFAGYSIMALGLGRIFGFTFPLNFNQPYISTSVREFWRRWHISLSSWFRDYLYIPLGGSRRGELITYRNLIIVFFVTGIWHGASWNFVIWGLFHGFFIVLERSSKIGGILDNMSQILKHIYLLLVVMIGWVFFRLEEFPDAVTMLKTMFVWTKHESEANPFSYLAYYFDGWTVTIFILAIIWACTSPKFGSMLMNKLGSEKSLQRDAVTMLGSFGLLIIAIGLVVSGSYSAFIYFRF